MNLTCVKCTSVLDKARVGDVEVDSVPELRRPVARSR